MAVRIQRADALGRLLLLAVFLFASLTEPVRAHANFTTASPSRPELRLGVETPCQPESAYPAIFAPHDQTNIGFVAHANPVNGIDPTGHLTLTELNTTVGNVLNLATKGFNAISRAKRAVNFVNAISDLITQIESGAIVELIRSEIVQAVQSWSTAGTETANLAKPEFWSAAGKALSREATSVARTVISEWAQTILNKYSRQSTAPFHWVLYMPTPADAGIPNPKIWLNVPKMEIGKAPVVLKFGHGDQRGRLFGMGLRDDNTHADIQFFRMDYHRPHKTFRSTWERRDAYYDAIEQDGFEFNFHVPRN